MDPKVNVSGNDFHSPPLKKWKFNIAFFGELNVITLVLLRFAAKCLLSQKLARASSWPLKALRGDDQKDHIICKQE
jgi:hypothetical protein